MHNLPHLSRSAATYRQRFPGPSQRFQADAFRDKEHDTLVWTSLGFSNILWLFFAYCRRDRKNRFRVRDTTMETNSAQALARPEEQWARPLELEQAEVFRLAGSID